MKIGSGRFRGRNIDAPKGDKTRPTSGRLKKALFDILAPDLPGADVLDLFAGAGALGLEAVSRGATGVVFVERGRRAAEAIAKNAEKLGVSENIEVLRVEVRHAIQLLAERGNRFQVIFLDPPYRSDIQNSVIETIEAASLLVSDGSVIVEHHHKQRLADSYGRLRQTRQVRAGESCLTFYRHEESVD
jgi:16S rRNA (guanine(966)-N(2))-methyltransferase RsmD